MLPVFFIFQQFLALLATKREAGNYKFGNSWEDVHKFSPIYDALQHFNFFHRYIQLIKCIDLCSTRKYLTCFMDCHQMLASGYLCILLHSSAGHSFSCICAKSIYGCKLTKSPAAPPRAQLSNHSSVQVLHMHCIPLTHLQLDRHTAREIMQLQLT